MQKKTKRDSISTHKEGRLDTFDRVVFLVEMGWCSNSRNAVQTAGPPLSDWTDSGKGQSPPEHAAQPLIRPDQIVESISQRFFSPLITPSQPARPIDFVRSANSKIWSEVVGTNRLLYRTKLYQGVLVGPLFSTITAGVDQLCDTDGHEEERRQRKCKREKIPDSEHVIDSTINLLNEGSLLTLSHQLEANPLTSFMPLCSKESKWGGLRFHSK